MIRTIATFLLTLSILFVSAQNEKNIIEISREDYSMVEVQIGSQKYTLINSDNSLISKGDKFRFVQGKGGEKDVNGFKGRQKEYLKNSNDETVAVVVRRKDKIVINNSIIYVLKSENGWKYISENGKECCDVKLYWNKKNWKFELTVKQNSALEKVVLMSLIDLAKEESKSKSNNSVELSVWRSLYLSTLTSNN